MRDEAPIWLFDGVCLLCSRAVQLTLKHERVPLIRFVAIQSEAGRALAEHHRIDPDDPETFLFIEAGKVLEKSEGVIALARHLTGPLSLLAWIRFLPKGLRDYLYTVIARHRYRLFGRTRKCLIPAGHHHRFIP